MVLLRRRPIIPLILNMLVVNGGLIVKPQPRTVFVGDSFTFDCASDVDHLVEWNTWRPGSMFHSWTIYRSDVGVYDRFLTRVFVNRTADDGVWGYPLQIFNVTTEDAAVYRCWDQELFNEHSDARLIVLPSRLTRKPSSQGVLLGRSARFNCSSPDEDAPIRWEKRVNENETLTVFKDKTIQEPFLKSGRFEIKPSRDGDGYLQINNVTAEDVGKYICLIKDTDDKAEAELSLCKGITTKPESKCVIEGSSAIFICSTDCLNAIINWAFLALSCDANAAKQKLRSDYDENSNYFRNKTEDGQHILRIKNVTQSDQGMYGCSIKNGNVNSFADLTVAAVAAAASSLSCSLGGLGIFFMVLPFTIFLSNRLP